MIGASHFHRGYALRSQKSKPLGNRGIISKAPTLSMQVGPLGTHIRGYNDQWKDALEPAIDALVDAGLMERQGSKVALTEKGKEEVFAYKTAERRPPLP